MNQHVHYVKLCNLTSCWLQNRWQYYCTWWIIYKHTCKVCYVC